MVSKKILSIISFFSIAVAAIVPDARACDLCSIYNSIDSTKPAPDMIRVGVAEQFTSFGKIQDSGKFVENTEHQHMESSITQLFGSYDLNDAVSFQLSVPYINRRYKRFEDGATERGTEAGVGDISLLVKYIPYEYREEDSTAFIQVFGGLKFATGDSDRLKEELEEGHDDTAEGHADEQMHLLAVSKHAGEDHGSEGSVASSIHGHDLALGSGSYDFPLGFNLFAQSGKVFATGSFQYTFRTEGDYNYQYADDLIWEYGPGFYLATKHDYTVALKANLSGEYKRKDTMGSETEGDTGVRSTFLGPELVATMGDWNAELAWDIPLDINNTEYQSVVDTKIRAAISYRF